ncbi:MAG TPA: squalene/phytoene synthase family protein [Luteimonas sp.]|nr:squalene/phytoene synthase family protein [Luteimonas sp.]
MSDVEALASFIDKWRARWPEWRVAEVFVPQAQRDAVQAWFALRQELLDAAWGGVDPVPGEAKLAWWAEELQGWSQGRRRHPLGIALQRLPAPWPLLAAGLPALRASRERAADTAQAITVLLPFAEGVVETAALLFACGTPVSAANLAVGLLAEQVLMQGDAAVPLRARAQLGDAMPEYAAARAWANELLQRWPPPDGSRPDRIHAALLRERLRCFAAGSTASEPLSRWRALWTAWRAARG